MTHQASHRFARIAPRKARLVADLIRGMRIDEAMNELQFSKKRAAWYLKAVLKSAIANAEERDADVSSLYVAESRVDEGPTIKRFQPKDRGRAHPIHKRTCHLHIVLNERG
ncbi:MAG: 50S ribosomal protein L22 [Phycisphaerales bacterium]|jgi:large subunit ribosomal protein L22|nr:50S ribosomal protein L22 [Phycisphaerales bacterium]MDP6311214.1 50S ribosomal protein L22 [Phycisphaerales bacterium]MDP6478504.1 50S ribosomal protein L22 [Phycisphaerales bacterium]MDP6890700.1 50S ribosomal protein L22 [Phycisphaerales bacterium]MDP7086373.1 50S ribosomal protein L22 [Phycisphaerales bacterium]|tara:strand:- start:102 stop:434 length:333 start_codon:yes stop_codon:yes gene_type:complete